jgi:hypothetical protein
MKLHHYVRTVKDAIRNAAHLDAQIETNLLLIGKMLMEGNRTKSVKTLADVEFKVFSQWGDDGIIQWLVDILDFPNKTFVEFGVETYRESNTRFLMMNNNWEGFVMDASERNIARIISSEYYWRYQLQARNAFIEIGNINTLLEESGFHKDVGLLHIDIDGNDYWIWKEIRVISPIVVILEYNSVFGPERALTVPYDSRFNRTEKHYSNLYFGASLSALCQLSNAKGYAFIGCNSAGNNAYFVRRDKLGAKLKELSPGEGYVLSKSREARNSAGRLTWLGGSARLEAIRGLPVFNVATDEIEAL